MLMPPLRIRTLPTRFQRRNKIIMIIPRMLEPTGGTSQAEMHSFKETRKMLRCDSFTSMCFTVGKSVQAHLNHEKSTNATNKPPPFQKLDNIKATTGQVKIAQRKTPSFHLRMNTFKKCELKARKC